MSPSSSGLAERLLVLALTLGPATGCGDDIPNPGLDGGNTSTGSTGSSTTGPMVTTVDGADTTAGTMSESMGSTAGTSSSGEPGSTGSSSGGSSSGTTQGVSATDTGDSTTSGGTTLDPTTSGGATSDATTSGGTTMDPTTSGGGMTSVATDFNASTSGDLVGTTDLTSGSSGGTSGGSTSGGSTDGGATDDGDTGNVVEVPDFTGDFLLVIATPLDPTLPFQYVATFDYLPSGFGGGSVDVELQPLALDTGSTTTPRTFFGPPLAFPGVPVTPDGTFAIPVGILNVAAETNPLFFIDAQANNVVISLQVLDIDDLCGTVAGFLVFPVASPLDGTTTAAVRVADPSPAGLPVVFPVACP